jgi:hypothetical protein
MSSPTHTEADFDRLSWHDNHLYGVRFDVGDADENDWTSDLILDIDHIVEWVCGTDNTTRFRVAPATLVFHGVTDPSMRIDWGDSGFRTAIYVLSIDRIERERISDQKVFLDRPYYSWRIVLNSPQGGEIRFGAVGFTQTLRAEPVLVDEQKLSPAQRRALTGTS